MKQTVHLLVRIHI